MQLKPYIYLCMSIAKLCSWLFYSSWVLWSLLTAGLKEFLISNFGWSAASFTSGTSAAAMSVLAFTSFVILHQK